MLPIGAVWRFLGEPWTGGRARAEDVDCAELCTGLGGFDATADASSNCALRQCKERTVMRYQIIGRGDGEAAAPQLLHVVDEVERRLALCASAIFRCLVLRFCPCQCARAADGSAASISASCSERTNVPVCELHRDVCLKVSGKDPPAAATQNGQRSGIPPSSRPPSRGAPAATTPLPRVGEAVGEPVRMPGGVGTFLAACAN